MSSKPTKLYDYENMPEILSDIDDITKKLISERYGSLVLNEKNPALKEMLRYSTFKSEFYGFLKEKLDLSLIDFPVVNKKVLKENKDLVFVRDYIHKDTHTMYTSGSTGTPFSVKQSMRKRRRHIADLKYYGRQAGIKEDDIIGYLRAKPTSNYEQQKLDRIYQFDISNLNSENMDLYYDSLVQLGCTTLMAYPSTLMTAVRYWSGKYRNNTRVKTIITTSEMLTDETYDIVTDFFGKDIGVYERYSNTENGVFGQKRYGAAYFDLNWASYYFEILEFNSDKRAKEGELGRIVVTDLYNKAFPLIRYDTGDAGAIQRFPDSAFPKLTSLMGRRMDIIFDTKGEPVSPLLLCRVLRMSRGIDQWQFIQENKHKYKLRLVYESNRVSINNEITEFKKILGENATINVEEVDSIPILPSLKQKLVISCLNS